MAIQTTLLRVFVSSPADVSEERVILEDVIEEINKVWGEANNTQLKLLKWEKDVYPGIGADPQSVINEQIGDEYDIFIGIMWGRFGTPTLRAGAGTIEEFERAFARWKESPKDIQIMFYFKDAGIPPSQCDPDQLANVREFKDQFGPKYGGIFHTFETAEEFRNTVRMHLGKHLQDWHQSNPNAGVVSKLEEAIPAKIDDSNPLANLSALKDDDDGEGIIELTERASNAINLSNTTLTIMTAATRELGDRIKGRADEADRSRAEQGSYNPRLAAKVANHAAEDIEAFVKTLSLEIPELQRHYSTAMDVFGTLVIQSGEFRHLNDDENREIDMLSNLLADLQASIASSSESISGFRKIVASLPPVTTALKRARRRAVAVLDDLLALFRRISERSNEVEKLLLLR